MPHELLVSNLEVYGVQSKSSKFILSYLSNRHLRVRVGEKCSSWQATSKGILQESVLNPMLFNVFLMIYFILSKLSCLHAYK